MDKEQRKAAIAPLVRRILQLLGEDPERGGLRETPQRVARMLVDELCEHGGVPLHKVAEGIKVFRVLPVSAL